MRIRRFFRPWLFILVGITFNVIAAFISHYLIEGTTAEIMALNEATERRQALIDSAWSSRMEVERKRELLLLQADRAGSDGRLASTGYVAEHVRGFIEGHNNTYLEGSLPAQLTAGEFLMVPVAQEQLDRIVRGVQDHIDGLYLEALELERAKAPLHQRRASLAGLALFLQVLGLILVLSRDLAGAGAQSSRPAAVSRRPR